MCFPNNWIEGLNEKEIQQNANSLVVIIVRTVVGNVDTALFIHLSSVRGIYWLDVLGLWCDVAIKKLDIELIY